MTSPLYLKQGIWPRWVLIRFNHQTQRTLHVSNILKLLSTFFLASLFINLLTPKLISDCNIFAFCLSLSHWITWESAVLGLRAHRDHCDHCDHWDSLSLEKESEVSYILHEITSNCYQHLHIFVCGFRSVSCFRTLCTDLLVRIGLRTSQAGRETAGETGSVLTLMFASCSKQ